MHILPNISQNKGNQAFQFSQVVEYNKRNFFFFFFENHVENESGRLVPDLFLFLKKAL